MTIVKADVLELKPGRTNDFLAAAESIRPFAQKFGASSFQVSRMMVGSQDTAFCIISGQWSDYQSLGRNFMDPSPSDTEYGKVISRLVGPDGAAIHRRMQLMTKVADFGTPMQTHPGCHLLVRFWRVELERLDEFIQIVADASELVQQFGTGVSLGRGTVAGEMSNSYLSVTPFPDMATVSAYLDAVETHPDPKGILKRAYGSNAPATQLSVRIDRVIA